MIDGHNEQVIIGICENVNCNQVQRKLCLSCVEIHQLNDNYFLVSDVKNEYGIKKIIDEFKKNNKYKIDNIYLQCQIQQYFLSLKLIEYTQQIRLKYQQLANIMIELGKFEKQTWNQINVTNYLKNDNIGIQTYLQQILQKLGKTDLAKDDYLHKINDQPLDQDKLENAKYSEIFGQFIKSLKKNKVDIFKKIIKNDLYKKESIIDNSSDSIHKMIKIQDQILKSNILDQQYDSIKYLVTNDEAKLKKKIQFHIKKAQQNKQRSIQLCQEEYGKILRGDLKICVCNQVRQEKCYSLLQQRNLLFKAIKIFSQAIKLDPNYVQAYNQKGEIIYKLLGIQLHQIKRYQEAIIMYDQANKLDPNNFNAYYNKGFYLNNIKIGITLNELKRYQDAMQMFDKVIKLDSKNALAYHNKGISFQNLEKYKESIEMFNKAIKFDPNYNHSQKGNLISYVLNFNRIFREINKQIRRYRDDLNVYIFAFFAWPVPICMLKDKVNMIYYKQKINKAFSLQMTN
ncbi:hypothetical protein pb186bvf_008590 [Paramecium bursaria]